MQQLRYEDIESLIENEQQERNRMEVVFICPVSAQRVEASVTIEKSDGMDSMVRAAVTFGLMMQFRSFLRGIFGYSMGRLISKLLGGSSMGVAGKIAFSPADREKAVVNAFRSVQSQFRWDEESGQWIHQSGSA